MRAFVTFPEGKAKVLTMSYDDGKRQDERLVAIFNKYGIKGTFNLNYGLMDRPERLDLPQVKDLYEGHEIATHSMTHPTMTRYPLARLAWEILEDRKGWESVVGYPVRGHAYPNGAYNQEIKDLLKSLGIVYARVVPSTEGFELPTDLLEWQPTCHHNNPRLMELGQTFIDFKKTQYLKCMYVWGHSYEFDNNDNWNVMEDFCALMSGKEDIWYATNIEIVDYMKAAKELQYSADSSLVYNPSAISVWVCVEDDGADFSKTYVEIKGGSLKKLW